MSAAMHFRKRQILEYQVQTDSKFLAGKKDEAFPSSPSSLESKTPSPVEDVAEPASVYAPPEHTPANPTLSEAIQSTSYNYAAQPNPYQVEANFKFLAGKKDEAFPSSPSSLESKTPSPVKDVAEPASVYAPPENSPANPTLTISEAIQSTPYSEHNYAPQPNPIDLTSSPTMKQEAEAWAHAALKLMQSIEYILMKQKQTVGQKPSALLMEKLNNLQGKSSSKPKQNRKPLAPEPKREFKSKPKPKPLTKNLKAKPANKIKNTVVKNHATSPQPLPYVKGKLDLSRLYDIIGVDPSCVKERSEVVADGSEVHEEQMAPVDMTITPSHSSFKAPKPKPLVQAKSMEELEHIRNRIKRILLKENDFQQKIEGFAENGVHVYEEVDLDYPHKSEAILIRSDDSRTYKYTPPAEIPSPKEPFVHITADTLPEELNHLTAVADKLNPPLQEKPSQISYPHASKDDDDKLIIGANGTQISKARWYDIDWKLTAQAIARKLMVAVFDRNILATHSLSGRPSPAFLNLNKPKKLQLDVKKVADIVSLVTGRKHATKKEVRMAMTSKCADECKLLKKFKGNIGKSSADKENARVEPYFIPVYSQNEE